MIFITGDSIDWALGTAGIIYSFIIELPPASKEANGPCTYEGIAGGTGFLLKESEILNVGKEQHAGLIAMLHKLLDDAPSTKIDM